MRESGDNEIIIRKVNQSSWVDWSIKNIIFGFDKISILIVDDGGDQLVNVSCEDFIGFEIVGYWDEGIIENINIETEGDLLTKSLNLIKRNYNNNPIPAGSKHLEDIWMQINIRLIDGMYIRVVCNKIDFKNQPI